MRRAALLALALLASPLRAEETSATLVADSVVMTSTETLVAAGHVEVFYKGAHVTATKVTYDAATDRLKIEGPIRIDDGTGTLILAEAADLSADLTEGLIRAARIVLDQQLQLAAAELQRSEGGAVTAMRGVAASSCKVCGNGPPLWEIRSAEVVHDARAQQIWFRDATLRFAGVPVIWLPMLRVPDPTLDRATGFLYPRFHSSTARGTGIALPYFITLGQSRDLTLTPDVTDQDGQSLGWRYRQAFNHGTAEIAGAFSRDKLMPDEMRGFVQAKADLDIGGGWTLGLDATAVTDPAYLQDYGISDADRLTSDLRLTRVKPDSFSTLGVTSARTLRTTESNATQPSLLTDGQTVLRFAPGAIGGTATLTAGFAAERRNATFGGDTNGDGIADGRDMGRFSLGADWGRRWISGNGLVWDAALQAGVDLYTIAEDDIYAGNAARTVTRAGLRLGYPMLRRDARGSLLFEPAIQLVTAATHADAAIPNEDSPLVEFDEANLFALDRYAGADAVETGTRLNLGASLTRQALDGGSWSIAAGRVFRFDGAQFSTASGLGGTRSDWLIGAQVQRGPTLFLGRALVDDSLSLTRFETRFALTGARAALSGGYEFVGADPTQGRSADVREIVLNGSAQLGDFWTLTAADRYDLSTQTTRASLGLGFRNECLSVDLSVSRRFTSSSIVEASSDIGLTVELLGLGGSSTGRAATTCRR